MRYETLTLNSLHELIVKKELSIKELLDYVFFNIEKYEGTIHAFLDIYKEESYKKAEELQKNLNENTPLIYGIPVAIKDNMVIKGKETTCASKILKGFIPPYTATSVKRLEESGAIILGKANMDEFAMGSSTENSAFGPTRNPWDPERVPGGSSGGSAASVAAGEAIFSLGSDTGGSIRQPASFTGTVGLKPTYGRVSRYGLVAFASSLDQIGPFARRIDTVFDVLSVIDGHDPMDSTSVKETYSLDIENISLKDLKIGIPKEYFGEGIDKEVKEIVKKNIEFLSKHVRDVVEVSLPHTKYALPTYYLIATAEASSNLARYDGVQYGFRTKDYENLIDMYKKTRSYGFGQEVKRRIMLGTYALSSGYYDAYYLKAQKVRTLIIEDFKKAFEEVDLLITPASPTTAFRIGEKIEDPLSMYLSDILTIPINLAGLPGLVVPGGKDRDGLPVGIQIIGSHFREDLLYKVGKFIEEENRFFEELPEIVLK